MNRILISNKYCGDVEVYFENTSSRFHLCNKHGHHISGCNLFRIDTSGLFLDSGVGSIDISPSIDTFDHNTKLVIVGVDEL